MKLILEKTQNKHLFQTSEVGNNICVSHFSIFDKDTFETDCITLEFNKNDYQNGLKKFKDNDFCELKGPYGSLSLIKGSDDKLKIIMKTTTGNRKSIEISDLSFHLED